MPTSSKSSKVETSAENSPNPLLALWAGAYGGTPPFGAVRLEHFEPALEAAMAEARAEYRAIGNNPEPATFDNTLLALEGAARRLDRVQAVYMVWESNLGGKGFQALDRRLAPRFAAFEDSMIQDKELFQRVEAVYRDADKQAWTPEQRRLAWWYYMRFVRAGAQLEEADAVRVGEINQRLAILYANFSQNVLYDEEHNATLVDREEELAGLPPSLLAAAAAEAARLGRPGQWALANTRSAVEPCLTFCSDRALRERVWRAFVNRGDGGGEHDNNAIVAEILQLRAERAKRLGYPTHAHWRLADSMAKTPDATLELMRSVWPAAVLRVREEVAAMRALRGAEPGQPAIAPWDYRYFAEKVRRQKYDLDDSEIKPYLELSSMREALFWVAGRLFGLVFEPAVDVATYHPDVRVWRVMQGEKGRTVGLWFFDPYARPGKHSGAWMNAYRAQQRVGGEVTPIVSNNANFIQPAPGRPSLLSWDDALTLFHEFGHALHGLLSSVTYPALSGTAVARDYVEFPSQLFESWLATPEVLSRFARHHATDAPMPPATIDKLERASHFNKGFEAVEYLATAWVDMQLHLAGGAPIDPDAFERETLAQLGMPPEVVMRHRTPQLNHVFAGDSYSAGYYSYLWADTLSADAFEAFQEGSGPYDSAVAQRLLRQVLSAGNSVDPAEAYRAFRGHDPGLGALMRKRGFPIVSSP